MACGVSSYAGAHFWSEVGQIDVCAGEHKTSYWVSPCYHTVLIIETKWYYDTFSITLQGNPSPAQS